MVEETSTSRPGAPDARLTAFLNALAAENEERIAAIAGDAAFLHASVRDGMQPLHVAAGVGSEVGVRILLKAGADPLTTDQRGLTPLHYAASRHVVTALLDAGVDPNIRDRFVGRTPMHTVHAPRVASALRAGGGDIHAVDQRGRTPLHVAAATGNLPLIDFFLTVGASPRATDKHGHLPITLAQAKGHAEAAQRLKAAISQLAQAELPTPVEPPAHIDTEPTSMSAITNLLGEHGMVAGESKEIDNLLKKIEHPEPTRSQHPLMAALRQHGGWLVAGMLLGALLLYLLAEAQQAAWTNRPGYPVITTRPIRGMSAVAATGSLSRRWQYRPKRVARNPVMHLHHADWRDQTTEIQALLNIYQDNPGNAVYAVEIIIDAYPKWTATDKMLAEITRNAGSEIFSLPCFTKREQGEGKVWLKRVAASNLQPGIFEEFETEAARVIISGDAWTRTCLVVAK